MIRVFRHDGSSFDAEDLGLAVAADDQEAVAIFPWSDLSKLVLIDGSVEVVDTTWREMPLRLLVWTDVSGLRFEIPLPHAMAEEMGRAMAGMKVQVAQDVPSKIWTPGRST